MKNLGIVSYGVYVPDFRIKVEEIAKTWGMNPTAISKGLNIESKSVPAPDEDVVTISVAAARAAMDRCSKNTHTQRLKKISPRYLNLVLPI